MYQKNPDGITWRVRKVLAAAGFGMMKLLKWKRPMKIVRIKNQLPSYHHLTKTAKHWPVVEKFMLPPNTTPDGPVCVLPGVVTGRGIGGGEGRCRKTSRQQQRC